jgi:protein-S-isoprenylcysteine O-methyltransferase Ste14
MKQTFDLIDVPPVWLALFVAAAWALGRLWHVPVGPLHAAGAVLVVAGLAVMLAAILTMAAARTTVIPRRDPAAMVSRGVFRWSRNPIYLGDALILTGAVLWLGAPVALLLVPVFVALITHRFILGEEARLRAAFGAEFDAWATRTRRWI